MRVVNPPTDSGPRHKEPSDGSGIKPRKKGKQINIGHGHVYRGTQGQDHEKIEELFDVRRRQLHPDQLSLALTAKLVIFYYQ